jgi:hypothetical protein
MKEIQNALSEVLSRIDVCGLYDTIQNYNIACFLYGCETWSLTVREERSLRVSANGMLCRIYGPKRTRLQGSGENYIMRSLMICTAHPILFG